MNAKEEIFKKKANKSESEFDISELPPKVREFIEAIQKELDRVGRGDLRAPLFCKTHDLFEPERLFTHWLKAQPSWLTNQEPTSTSTAYRMITELRQVKGVAAQVAKSYLRSGVAESPDEWLKAVFTLAENQIKLGCQLEFQLATVG